MCVCMYTLRQSCNRIPKSRSLCDGIVCSEAAPGYPRVGTVPVCIYTVTISRAVPGDLKVGSPMYMFNQQWPAPVYQKVGFLCTHNLQGSCTKILKSWYRCVYMYTRQQGCNRIPEPRLLWVCIAHSGAVLTSIPESRSCVYV